MKKQVMALIGAALLCFCLMMAGQAAGAPQAEAGAYSYTVEFAYGGLQYVLPGGRSAPLAEILDALGLNGDVTAAEASDPALFSVSDVTGEWLVTANRAFSTAETLRVAIGGTAYEIAVTDDYQPTYTVAAYKNAEGVLCGVYGIKVEPQTTAMTNNSTVAGGWYIVNEDVTIEDILNVEGKVFTDGTDEYGPGVVSDTGSLAEKTLMSPSSKHTITIMGGIAHGRVLADKASACRGTAVTLTFIADDGWQPIAGCWNDGVAEHLIAVNNAACSFVMPDANVAVSAVFIPEISASEYLALPDGLTEIGEEAFQGVKARAVTLPETCASIGARAFKDASGLTFISIPADCTVGADAFDGCTLVYVYGYAGSSAESYCRENSNCIFVEMAGE